MNAARREVLIMAGGTGGHIFPGLAVADSLRGSGVEVRWLGARGGMECQKVPEARIQLDVVDITGLRGKGAARWLLMPWKLVRAVFQAFRLLGRHRPACAISFGGYAAGPGGLAARLRGIPLLVHEQNRIPGMTNKVLARLAGKVLQAFPGTWALKLHPVTCGNPVRQPVADLPAPAHRMSGREGAVRVLITGGSQGARALNRIVPGALAQLRGCPGLEIRHQAGKGWAEETTQAYRAAPLDAEVTEFIEDMAGAYAWADIVVCRSGALTVSELAAAGVAAVLVPFPFAVDDHQTRNAEFLVEAGAALLLPENRLDAATLAHTLEPLVSERGKLVVMAECARSVAVPDSADRVARLCREYLSK
ncbi:MAG: undecaprenyldiphospho-muramoylpentapeptide beta-N-acetylglucosaminyltransferase [Xanthomonadales bacterium]|nr:undecaprenyldiphospho-muramoylpentapeptide beta-N-acetylglucosaminyltransferase [Gammaproteobacteria bacterium]MBT8052588.1 undecaprenyldiphospho-muramoylpentapeptide beta-N-acetylglucosaminyltransferase [Gammaproteobacteria bacterium]NND56653.1 undecaprenyldiphospho-muramoylpentapeptide beta-N-acetylglucosaminyltransferase [Xanthomonadales bacterium]NNK52405.1 undecaprenyldiphospho-muramoylpentapeptide beta-N-acetylglucosaminyltransferase [Xanthomonadales bacterium]